MADSAQLPPDTLSWLRLTLVPGVSPAAQQRLLRAFGTPECVVDAPREAVARCAGDEVACALDKGVDRSLLERTLEWLRLPGRHLVALGDPHYPRALLDIPDPPSVLYARGRLELLNAEAIGIIGSRNATPQGLRDAHAFAAALSDAGLCIVSGLALGIDAAAHRGGLAGAGSSVAVLGTGADRIYPARNRDLARQLESEGCIISEFALGTAPVRCNFPRRNRLISGMSRGVLVVEAAAESGSLITAHLALDQSRDVFALPGSIHSPLSKGCHLLIKEGAKLVDDVDDILAEIGRSARASAPRTLARAGTRDALLESMGDAPISMDEIATHCRLGASEVAARLSQLEIEGLVSALPGGWFQRVAAS